MTTQQEQPAIGLDDPWLAEPPKRSRLRLVLAILLAAAVVFYAGVEVQRRYGAAAADAAAGPQAGAFTPPDGASFPGGAMPGSGSSESTDTGDGGSDTAGASSVIGTVVSLKGNKIVVKDFGGKRHTITLDSEIKVVLETTGDADDITRGSTVQVDGQQDDQGQVQATTITVR